MDHYIKGDKVGLFTFVEDAGYRIDPKWGKKRRMVKVKCSCGKEIVTTLSPIKRGVIKSCGCYTIKRTHEANTKHGLCKHPLYGQWQDIKNRCNNPNIKGYEYYGGRGISVCEEWTNSFLPFYNWAMENGWEWGLSINRRNSNGNYEPSNCRLATSSQQARNTRRNVIVEYKDKKFCITDLCIELNLNYPCIRHRITDLGWSVERAVTTEIKSDKIKRLNEQRTGIFQY